MHQRMTALAATPEIKSTLQSLKTTHEGFSPAKKKKQEQKHKKNKLKG
jgi:hypothetical protein